ncbi:unnamed protein product [Blepharisma stoltei]|uniref:Uncharacterized protein n=1 Tax=Blepharisma stoltei TaxID=1481888 RepID=A0AAU9JT85_9CILI|nr:unnamed protein product [Blepharisma stoltei]
MGSCCGSNNTKIAPSKNDQNTSTAGKRRSSKLQKWLKKMKIVPKLHKAQDNPLFIRRKISKNKDFKLDDLVDVHYVSTN